MNRTYQIFSYVHARRTKGPWPPDWQCGCCLPLLWLVKGQVWHNPFLSFLDQWPSQPLFQSFCVVSHQRVQQLAKPIASFSNMIFFDTSGCLVQNCANCSKNTNECETCDQNYELANKTYCIGMLLICLLVYFLRFSR